MDNQSHLRLADIAYNISDFYVLKINQLANELIKQGRDIIKLNLGKSELPMPDYVTEEIINKMRDSQQRELIDPQGILPLREAIAQDYQVSHRVNISPDQVFINNGTSPFFLAFFLLLTNPGEDILLPRPYYPTYAANANMVRANSKFYNINNGRINMEELKNNFIPGQTKIVFLNSPGNPYGNVLSREELQEIVDFVDGRAYIISDEIYDGFVYHDNFTSIIDVYNPIKDKVIVINGFSKIHHMYTRRLGYAIVPDELRATLLKFQQYTLVCVDPVTQFGGLAALKNKGNFIQDETRKEVAEYKNRLNECRSLIAASRRKLIEPEGSFYMCVNVSSYLTDQTPNSLALAKDILQAVNVAVTPGEDFGMPDIFRISLTGNRTVEGVKKMCEYLESLK